MRDTLTFDDVLIVPSYSDIETRGDISVAPDFLFEMSLPIISANMDYVTGAEMAIAMRQNGALGILHRFYKSPAQFTLDLMDLWEEDRDFPVIISLGTRNPKDSLVQLQRVMYPSDYSEYADSIEYNGTFPYAVCIDVAHGEHSKVLGLIDNIKNNYPDIKVIAGNVATATGYLRLADAGADAIKVGIGPGSVCTTREVTGVGVPQLSAILDIADARRVRFNDTQKGPYIIADGGIKNSGDIVKALAAGADVVMLGSLLAGSPECPGEVRVAPDNSRWRPYRGQSIFGVNGEKFVPEGISGWVKEKPPVAETLAKLAGGIRSGMSYVGARNLTELRENAEFIKISHSTHYESSTRVQVDI